MQYPQVSNYRRYLMPISGFIHATILFSALSSYLLFIGHFHIILGVSSKELEFTGSLVYFAGMPFGKILGRFLKFYKHIISSSALLLLIIIVTILLMPYVSSYSVLLVFRFIQGAATILMEVFSVSYSFIYNERSRSLASAVSISGVPAGVALGMIFPVWFNMNLYLVYGTMGIIALLTLVPFLYLFNINIPALNIEKSGTTYKRPVTWIMGMLWISIAGFNLVLALILPEYLIIYNSENLLTIMNIFGYWGAVATMMGGVFAYILYPYTHGDRALTLVAAIGYTLAIPGFLIFSFDHTTYLLVIGMILIQFETFAIAPIYSLPRRLYEKEMVGKGTWEFALVGSTGHIIAPLTMIPLAFIIGFDHIFLILMLFPIYGAVLMLILPKFFLKKPKNTRLPHNRLKKTPSRV